MRLTAALLAIFAMAACGVGVAPAEKSAQVDPTSMQVLASSAVPGLSSTTTVLTQDQLAKEASIPRLQSLMTSWGFAGGRERDFQGESRHLSLVISRALVFSNVNGARDFVSFVKQNSGAFFGGVVGVQPLVAQGRSGWLFTPQGCSCHMANPAIAGVVNSGQGVVWLEINGPDATPALLVSLLDPANSVPATSPG